MIKLRLELSKRRLKGELRGQSHAIIDPSAIKAELLCAYNEKLRWEQYCHKYDDLFRSKETTDNSAKSHAVGIACQTLKKMGCSYAILYKLLVECDQLKVNLDPNILDTSSEFNFKTSMTDLD